ncbi:hypothetical protein Psi01_51240 [Planobispora siamensis]|uniref:Uncharacterized protein n=1 Tax=Planobispora siamensis TaxID=936338 RepID=A0A8J3SLE3_9ACTN|nr:hypothetical protein Psi01_51240 [Planobispora siamensis]
MTTRLPIDAMNAETPVIRSVGRTPSRLSTGHLRPEPAGLPPATETAAVHPSKAVISVVGLTAHSVTAPGPEQGRRGAAQRTDGRGARWRVRRAGPITPAGEAGSVLRLTTGDGPGGYLPVRRKRPAGRPYRHHPTGVTIAPPRPARTRTRTRTEEGRSPCPRTGSDSALPGGSPPYVTAAPGRTTPDS